MTRLANRYELGGLLGSGGFATVYRARDLTSNADVAVKIIPVTAADADAGERFRREALAVSHLKSPNVVRVHDFGRDDALGLYLVMELVEGVPLEPGRFGRVLLAHEVLRAARALLGGLAEAHASGIVHRDVKPTNILVPNGIAGLGELKLLDFGLARSERRAQLDAELGPHAPRQARRAIGTLAYMAPELLLGEDSTPAADVYAAGLVLYELLGNALLFPDAPSRDQVTLRTKTDPTIRGRIPAPLDDLLARMLERDPVRRFPDAGEALTALLNTETAPVDLDELAERMGHKPESAGPPPSRALRKSTMPPEAYFDLRPGAQVARVAHLDDDPIIALRECLHLCDLPMLDALGRREREDELGRAARAIVLTLRLEIDAAAALLEPLRARRPLSRGIGVCLVATRARAATRSKLMRGVDDDGWIDGIDPEVGQLLLAIEAALSGPTQMSPCLARIDRLLARSHTPSLAHTTLRLAQVAMTAGTRAAYAEGKRAWDAVVLAEGTVQQTPLVGIVRGILLGILAFRTDGIVARASFEHAVTLAASVGATLFEARALVSLGGMLVEVPQRFDEGRAALKRATALLLHADAPSIEHLAAHNRAVGLGIERQFPSAARQFRRAREVASGELALELEVLSCSGEVQSYLAAGQFEEAKAGVRRLEASRNVGALAPREAMYAAICISLVQLIEKGIEPARAELRRALDTLRDARDTLLLAQGLDLVYAAMMGESVDWLARAAELHRTAEEHGYAPFHWYEAARAFLARLPDDALREAGVHAVDKLMVLLGPPK